jgi:50S ribosomal subunit-associated GTPase HflX
MRRSPAFFREVFMHEQNIELLRDEAQRLLQVEVQLLEQMRNEPGVVAHERAGEQQTFTSTSIDKDIEVLNGELKKLGELEMVLAVVGTMKAGKSTTINAIVGTEVLPNRNRPMTALPTLIRHTPRQVVPMLRFDNNQPINALMTRLQHVLGSTAAQAQLEEVNDNADMQQLLHQIRAGEPFGTRYEGAHAISEFLKNLNDLVRLSRDLDTDFPFSSYDEVHEMPVIEVEFAHLKEAGQTSGRLTLLDTPGPNESGQPHLRKMLTEQLSKASAVLAVMDFTQLKSDADEEVRKELNEIASVAKGRLFTLVNKFDQKDSNSDDEEQVKKFVAMKLMRGALKLTDVYPVSSRQAYLASRARHELAVGNQLPNPKTNPWVEDFAKVAIGGPRWADKINDPQEVNSGADWLWEQSLFSSPMKNVIHTAHAQAATIAIDSAASKLVHTAERLEKFLGIRETALAKNARELRQQIDSLKSDIESIEQIQVQTRQDADEALLNIQRQTGELFARIKSDTERQIKIYFQEGKSLEQKQSIARQKELAETHARPEKLFMGLLQNLIGSQNRTSAKNDAEPDFDPKNPIIKFDSASDAQNLTRKIDAAVKREIQYAEKNMLRAMELILQSFKQHFTVDVASKAQGIIDGLNTRLTADGFKIEVKLPDTVTLSLNLAAGEMLSNVVSQKDRSVTRYRRSEGLWGTVCSWFDSSDWGWESYETTEGYYEIDINQVKKVVAGAIGKVFNDLDAVVTQSIKTPLDQGVEMFFSEFIITVEHIRGDLLQGIRDQETSRSEQQALGRRLSELKRNVPGILADSRDLKSDADQLNPMNSEALA